MKMSKSLRILTMTLTALLGLRSAGRCSEFTFKDLPILAAAKAPWTPNQDQFTPVDWVTITGGMFTMGTDDGRSDAGPRRKVAIKTFEMTKSLVTVAQYKECVDQGRCTEPATGGLCNWGKAGRRLHPVNCVDWEQANQFAKFKGSGARLPSESEWEYAATSGGKKRKYPWGDEKTTCQRAVMDGNGGSFCGDGGTMPVLSSDGKDCARNAGQTAQGLCDMTGHVWQWIQDKAWNSYAGAPNDGSAFEASGYGRVLRGGVFSGVHTELLRNDYRAGSYPDRRVAGIGFRLARTIP